MEWEVGVSRYKLLSIAWINNKVLLYNTGNIQYPMINHNGKEILKRMHNIYACINSQAAQWVKNLPAVGETQMWVRALAWEEEGLAAHSRILA